MENIFLLNFVCKFLVLDPPRITSVRPEGTTPALLYSGASFECHADAMPPAEYR